MNEELTLTKHDREQYWYAKEAIEGRVSMARASELMGVSERQGARIVARVRAEGAAGVQHRLRGKPSNHRVSEERCARLTHVIKEQYADFGPTLVAEKLAEEHGERVSVGLVRRLMQASGQWTAGRQGQRHRARRERRARWGELVQMDGRYHDWFEGRREKAVLIALIDDATSAVGYAVFVEQETTAAVMRAMWAYIERHGIPQSLYVDRDSIYVVNRQATVDEQLRDAQPQTHFDYAMEALDVRVILAHSPQAKGRVERLFKTLQDRLVKELRLRGIDTPEDANAYLWQNYLPAHNAQCAVVAQEAQDTHRPARSQAELAAVFCRREPRVVQQDYTVKYRRTTYQLLRQQAVRVTPRTQIVVEERLDGSRRLVYRGVELQATDSTGLERPKRNGVRRVKEMPVPGRIGQWKPAAGHPWRRGWKTGRPGAAHETHLAHMTFLHVVNHDISKNLQQGHRGPLRIRNDFATIKSYAA